MTRLLARLGTIFLTAVFRLMVSLCLIAGLSACVDREGPDDPEKTVRNFVDPPPEGGQQYQRIVEPFVGTLVQGGDTVTNSQAVSLFSFDSELDPANATIEILTSDISGGRRGIVQALNTSHDDSSRSEYSVVVKNDTIFVVDHEDGSYRGVVHFLEAVCALKPKKLVQQTMTGANVSYRVLHDEAIYVMTAEGSGSASDCSNPDAFKRYYKLTLNFRFDAFEGDPRHANDLISVSEAEYSAELLFGWNDAQATLSNPNQQLDYGFLGYDSQTRELVFFDRNRQRVWSQARRLERFDSTSEGSAYLPETWFKVEALPHYQAVVQLGRDVFVVDVGTEFFNRTPAEIPTILSDRIYQKVAEAENKYTQELDVVHNETDVLIRDADKLYRYAYAPESQPPSAFIYTVHDLPVLGYGNENYEQKHLFSQFDLRPCRLFSNTGECELVNFHQRANAADWQFVTACTSEVGCSMPVDTTDYCTTQAEFILTQDGRNMCRVLHYTHLNELNNRSNDASLVGFMPYVATYARSLELQMDAQSVFITARMNERDILLRYFYQIPLSAPKPSRERVIFGQRIAHAGLDVYLHEGNLFVTSLNNSGPNPNVRSNECYRDYQRINCEDCPPEDVENGSCVNHFNEYRSMALFCSSQELADDACTDSQIIPVNQLIANDPERDGKWLEVLSAPAAGVASRSLSLLQSDSVRDEGVLSSPSILFVDNQTGVVDQDPDDVLGEISGLVETVQGRWDLNAQISQLNLIRQDILTSNVSYAEAAVLFVDTSSQQGIQPVEAGAVHFVRRPDVLPEIDAD